MEPRYSRKYFTLNWPIKEYEEAKELANTLNEPFRTMVRRLVRQEKERVNKEQSHPTEGDLAKVVGETATNVEVAIGVQRHEQLYSK